MQGVESETPTDFNIARTCEIVVSLVITPLGTALCVSAMPSTVFNFVPSIFKS